jgi:hypothetical protein
MLAGPFPGELVIERLEGVSLLQSVDGAAGLETAMNVQPKKLPAAYVIVEERGKRGEYSGMHAQPIDVLVHVVLWITHAGSAANGAKAVGAMTQLERAVRTALCDWSPGAPFEGLYVASSGGDMYFGGRLIRRVAFHSHYRDQEMP